MSEPTSPFLRLPYEIRLMIYEYLLFPSKTPSSSYSTSVADILPDFHTYYSADKDSTPFTLAVRTIDPYAGAHSSCTWRRRSTYYVHTGPFLTTPTPTTYRILLSPYTAHLRHIIPSLLPLNHQIHTEAAKLLYSTYTFSFHTAIEAAVPFFSDLTPVARRCVRSVALTKRGVPWTKEFDRLEWAALCKYLASNVQLARLRLCVVAGKPGGSGWDDVPPISADTFALMRKVQGEWGSGVGGVDLSWAEQLFEIGGLREVDVKALVERCSGPVSEGMAGWIAVSRSVEEGAFGEWVRGVMVG